MADHEGGADLDRVCCNCNYSHPAERGYSDHGICLRDPHIEPYLDDILERQDFGRCIQLVEQKRFAWDREACADFDPIEDDGVECSAGIDAALEHLGLLVMNQDRRAFDTLCDHLKKQEPPATLAQSHLKCKLLYYLESDRRYDQELAGLLVDDLFKTPSNNQTRGWYTSVFRFFERNAPELAEEHLGLMLETPRFSYRIKRRVRGIIRGCQEAAAHWPGL